MGTPPELNARYYFRCAIHRYEDGQILLRAKRTTGAVYLAGYGVECVLKALILSAQPPKTRLGVLDLFRGARGHDFEWLRKLYLTTGGTPIPREIARYLVLVGDWSTELRYTPRTLRDDEAELFFEAADRILSWAKGRL